jgi:hypothetical protein
LFVDGVKCVGEGLGMIGVDDKAPTSFERLICFPFEGRRIIIPIHSK